MSNLLVIGSEGFIGKALTSKLYEQGRSIFTLDVKPSSRSQHHIVDIRDYRSVEDVFEQVKPEVVIHLAAQIDVRQSFADPIQDLAINGAGILNVITNAFNFGCMNFCYIHSGGAVYDSNQNLPISEVGKELPQSPYGLTKNLGEGYVRVFAEKNNVKWSSLALSNCYGPIKDHGRGVIFEFVKAIQNGTVPEIFGARTTRDFIYIDDVVDAISLAIENPTNCRVNVSSSTETNLLELYSKIARFYKSEIQPIVKDAKFGEVTRSSLSNQKAKELLGWSPQTILDSGLTKALRG